MRHQLLSVPSHESSTSEEAELNFSGVSNHLGLCSLRSIVNNSLELCLPQMKVRGVEYRSDWQGDVEVNCRPEQISHIILSLINNSIVAVERLDERWVEIEVSVLQDRLQLIVRDSGGGVSDEVLEKSMKPVRPHPELHQERPVGLGISKAIANENNGDVVYLPGAHTAFALHLFHHKAD